MPSFYLVIEELENFGTKKLLDDYGYGFNERHQNMTKSLQAGDLLVDYVTKYGFACIIEVSTWERGEICKKCPPDFGPTSGEYPWRIRVKTLLRINDRTEMLRYGDMENKLECCHEKSDLSKPLKNAQWMRGKQLIKISEHDFNIIRKEISKVVPDQVIPNPIKPKLTNVPIRQPDLEKRQEVEKKAQDAVFLWYSNKGYQVEDVSNQNKGWDLEAQRGDEHLLIEVKGRSGSEGIAELTPNEYKPLKNKELNYRLCIVTNALIEAERVIQVFLFNKETSTWRDREGKTLVIDEKIAANVKVNPINFSFN